MQMHVYIACPIADPWLQTSWKAYADDFRPLRVQQADVRPTKHGCWGVQYEEFFSEMR